MGQGIFNAEKQRRGEAEVIWSWGSTPYPECGLIVVIGKSLVASSG